MGKRKKVARESVWEILMVLFAEEVEKNPLYLLLPVLLNPLWIAVTLGIKPIAEVLGRMTPFLEALKGLPMYAGLATLIFMLFILANARLWVRWTEARTAKEEQRKEDAKKLVVEYMSLATPIMRGDRLLISESQIIADELKQYGLHPPSSDPKINNEYYIRLLRFLREDRYGLDRIKAEAARLRKMYV